MCGRIISSEGYKMDPHNFPIPDHILCIHTDASERYWSAVITQVPKEHIGRPLENQDHKEMAFLGGEFTGAERIWTTYEK